MNARALWIHLAIVSSVVAGCSSSPDSESGSSSGASSGSVMTSGASSGSGASTGSSSGANSGYLLGAISGQSGGPSGSSSTGSVATEDAGEANDTGTSTDMPDVTVDTTPPMEASAPPTDSSGSPGTGKVIDGGTGASSFHCVNWAVNGDNYQAGPLILSAMNSSSDTYAQVQNTSNIVLSAFVDLLGANCVRIPINEPTATTAWWNSYKAVIDTATAKGMKIMIGYWVKDSGHGQPYDQNAFFSMWQIVVSAYANNPLVYFDIHNEPFGFNQAGLTTLCKTWVSKFTTVPMGQIIIPGTGWDDNVTGMGAAFPGYLLQLHIYAIGKSGPTTAAAWSSDLASVVGQYANRTIVGEWGNGVRGVDYTAAVNNNVGLAYVDGVSNQIHDTKMGSGFWPGLWAGTNNTSSWSLLTMNGTYPNYTFTVQGASALQKVQHSWGLN